MYVIGPSPPRPKLVTPCYKSAPALDHCLSLTMQALATSMQKQDCRFHRFSDHGRHPRDWGSRRVAFTSTFARIQLSTWVYNTKAASSNILFWENCICGGDRVWNAFRKQFTSGCPQLAKSSALRAVSSPALKMIPSSFATCQATNFGCKSGRQHFESNACTIRLDFAVPNRQESCLGLHTLPNSLHSRPDRGRWASSLDALPARESSPSRSRALLRICDLLSAMGLATKTVLMKAFPNSSKNVGGSFQSPIRWGGNTKRARIVWQFVMAGLFVHGFVNGFWDVLLKRLCLIK